MHIDKEKRIWFSKEEMKGITGALHAFSYQMWRAEKASAFQNIQKKFLCSVPDVKYAQSWFATLYNGCKKDAHIFLFGDVAERLQVIGVVLDQCTKHFIKYEVADLGQLSKKELTKVCRDFKELSLGLAKVKLENIN